MVVWNRRTVVSKKAITVDFLVWVVLLQPATATGYADSRRQLKQMMRGTRIYYHRATRRVNTLGQFCLSIRASDNLPDIRSWDKICCKRLNFSLPCHHCNLQKQNTVSKFGALNRLQARHEKFRDFPAVGYISRIYLGNVQNRHRQRSHRM